MKSISAAELKSLRDNNEAHTLIDVRESHEYEMANIGGEFIPMNEIPNRCAEVPKEGKVIIHCRSGMRSANVINYLEQTHGYDNLYNLEGGIMAWAREIDPSLNVQ